MKNNFLKILSCLFLFTNSLTLATSSQQFVEIPDLMPEKVLKVYLLDKDSIQIRKTNTARYFDYCSIQNECQSLAIIQLDILSKKIQISRSNPADDFKLAMSEMVLSSISYANNKFITQVSSTRGLNIAGGAMGLALSNSLYLLPYKSLSNEDYTAIKNTFLSVNVLDKSSGVIEFPVSSATYLEQMARAYSALKNIK